jgi:hypothetical protein
MKIKTSGLIGAQLDWAVAKCEGGFDLNQRQDWDNKPWFFYFRDDEDPERVDKIYLSEYEPSTDWSQGGPIIEREGINIRTIRKEGHAMHGEWLAAYDHGNTGTTVQWVKRECWPKHYWKSPSILVAAMRCYVASKLGDEIEIPDELGAPS